MFPTNLTYYDIIDHILSAFYYLFLPVFGMGGSTLEYYARLHQSTEAVQNDDRS